MTTQKLYATLLKIAIPIVIALFLLTFSFNKQEFILDDDLQNSFRFELVKSLLELLVIVILGGVVTMIFKGVESGRAHAKLRIEVWKDYLKRIGALYRNVKRARRALTAGGRQGYQPEAFRAAGANPTKNLMAE